MTALTSVSFELAGRSIDMLVRPGTLDEEILREVRKTYPIGELVEHLRSKPTVCVFDIGAHIGGFSVTIATLLPQAIVHAFEPAPDNFEVLQQNVRHAGLEERVRIRHAGISGRRAGFMAAADIGRSPDLRNTGGHSVLGARVHDVAPAGDGFVELIELGTLIDRESHIDVMKIDCEGSEFEILYSLSPAQLAKIDAMTGEIHSCQGFVGSATDGLAWNATALKAYLGRRYTAIRSDFCVETDTASLETFYATSRRTLGERLFERVARHLRFNKPSLE